MSERRETVLRDPHKAIDFIYRQAPLYAKAKAERVRLEEFRKSKKALLMAECEAPAVRTFCQKNNVELKDQP